MSKKPFATFAVCAIVLALADACHAGTVVSNFGVTYNGLDPSLHYSSSLSVALYSSTSTHTSSTLLSPSGGVTLGQGGGFDWAIKSTSLSQVQGWKFVGPNGAPSSTNILTFCIDLKEHVPSQGGSSTVSIVTLDSSPKDTSGSSPLGSGGMGTNAGLIAELWGQFFNNVVNDVNVPLSDKSKSYALSESQLAAAFQLAIWKLEYDGLSNNALTVSSSSASWNSGYFVASASRTSGTSVDYNFEILETAKYWIDHLNSTGPKANLYALSANGFQDQVFAVVSAPEPASSLIWLAVGLVGFAKLRRRNAVQPA